MSSSPLQMNKSTSKTRKAFLAAGLLSGAALSSIVFAAPASAADCGMVTTISSLGVAGSCTTSGGWTFLLNSYSGFAANDNLSFTGGGGTPPTSSPLTYGILQQAGPWTSSGNPYKINYTVTAPTPKLLSMYTSSLTSSVSGVPGGDAGTWDVSGTPGAAMATFSTPGSVNGMKTYSPGLASDTFTGTLNVTSGQIQSVTSTINNKDATNTVPGPLPLLGAGAAFGFSRRIRSRIKLAA